MRRLDEKWTTAQREAIRARGETLLVSAAAGSGKTAVLTERIIDRVLDEEHPLDLTQILVVTFTKAAAAELKSRIRAALEGELAKNPDNRRLHTQLLSVGRAKICTIDSFCLDLIRTHFDDLGLSPRISIADEAQAKLTAKTVMNTLIDDYFDGNITDEAKTIDDFGAFTDLFATARASSALADVLLSVRETVNGYEAGVDWLFAQAEALSASAQTPFLQSPPGAGLLCELRAWCAEWLAQYRALCEFLDSDAVYAKNYGDCFLFERDWLYALESLLAQAPDWDAVRAHLLSFSAPALKSGIRGDKKTQDIIRAKNRHDQFGEQRKAYTERYFTVSATELRTLNLAQAEVIRMLGIFLSVYEERLAQEKRRRNQLDFGDMGRLALRLLWDAQAGTPTAAARAESLKYEEIYIDEYQDVSPVQDLIFRAIARGDNRFMVGDAKQSIYGFRGASPELFLNYRAQFAADPSAGRTVFLSDNFRCDQQIIDFSNLVFSVLFGRGGGILPYTDDDALRCAKRPEGEAQQTAVSLALFTSDREETEGGDDTPEEISAAADGEEPYTEGVYIADCVEQLLRSGKKRDGSRIRPRDIAILLRSAKTAAEPIAAALEARGIPCFNTVSRAFFENAEVMLMYSLLAVIDNPQRDVFLAGTLKSPLYRVTLDELIYMRRRYENGTLYDALCAFVAETGFEKGRYFLERLEEYRHLSEGMPADRFLWYLYQDTGILSLVYEKEKHELFSEALDSAQMRANLMMFYEYARSFERGGFQGLYPFVAFIGSVIEEKAQLPPVLLSGEDADAVHIMTVHQSKGLEFPVCFLCGCGKRFNDADLKKPVLMDAGAGIATWLSDNTGLAKIHHPVRECIRGVLSQKQKEEEARVLYVALTRAREQLYITGTCADPAALYDSFDCPTPDAVTPSLLQAQSSSLAWMLCAIAAHAGAAALPVTILYPQKPEPNAAAEDASDADPAARRREDEGITLRAAKAQIDKRFSFVYPAEDETRLPAKLSVSELQRMTQASCPPPAVPAGETTNIPEDMVQKTYAKPRFMTEEEEMPASAAERGTATHIFMQFCDFAVLGDTAVSPKERIECEIARLRDRHFITAETAANIDRKTLQTFLKSDLFVRLQKAETVTREMRFNLFLPASALPEFASSEAQVLVQGVVDCYYIGADGSVVLVDYKTDHFPHTVLRDRAHVEAILRTRYAGQLACYRAAVEQLLCRPVSDVRIYSFALGDDFSII